jgi:hypothetical protein
MEEYFLRLWNDFGARVSGPMSFRLLMQPTMALIFAIRDGVKDAKTERTPYFYSLFTDPAHRRQRLSEGWRAVVKIFTLAVILDVLFQLIVFRWIYPFEVVFIALLLAFLPYVLARGPVNRIARSFLHKRSQSERA